MVRGPIWNKKNIESEKTKKTNNSTSSTQQLKVRDSNASVLTTDKLNELKGHIGCDYPNKARIAEVKPKKIIKTLSLVKYYINGYHLESINLSKKSKKSIKYHLLYQFYFTIILSQEIIICELKTKDSNLWAITCVCRRASSTVNNSDNLNVFLKTISDKCNANLTVSADLNYPKIGWVYYSTNSSISDSNYKFLETTIYYFFPTICEKFNKMWWWGGEHLVEDFWSFFSILAALDRHCRNEDWNRIISEDRFLYVCCFFTTLLKK